MLALEDSRVSMETPFSGLTERQALVALLIGTGLDLGDIARRLDITKAQVQHHCRTLMNYWNVSSYNALVSRIVRAQMEQDRSKAQYLFEEVLPVLSGAEIVTPFLHEKEWCGLAVRLRNGRLRRVWLLNNPDGDEAGWLEID